MPAASCRDQRSIADAAIVVDHAGRREISVNTANPQKVFCCHAYGCQLRGNLATLAALEGSSCLIW